MNHLEIRTRVLERIEADPADAQWKAAATSAINEGQRLFVFLTLSLETVRPLNLTPGIAFYRMLQIGFDDWLLPLRLTLINPLPGETTPALSGDTLGDDKTPDQPGDGTDARSKLRPSSIYEMAAADSGFLNASGLPTRYGCLGWDLLFFNQQPVAGQRLQVTYARSSNSLVQDGDVPEIHDADHQVLIDYGVARLRANEGGQELTLASSLLKGFLEAAKKRAAQVRARSMAQGYDRQPAELDFQQTT